MRKHQRNPRQTDIKVHVDCLAVEQYAEQISSGCVWNNGGRDLRLCQTLGDDPVIFFYTTCFLTLFIGYYRLVLCSGGGLHYT